MGKGLNGNWIEIFAAGRHTDSSGVTRDWTEADLDAIVSKYNPSHHEAPIVVGHPKDTSPAFGWVEGLKREGKILLAKLKQVPPEFEDAVKEGRYKKRSLSLYPDLTLRHIGFLGGMPPAVKGLADIAFSADDQATVIEFGDWSDRLGAGMWRRMRDWLISKFGLDTADQVIPDYEIAELERMANQPDPDKTETGVQSFKEKQEEQMKTIEQLQQELAAKEAELARFAEKDQAQETEINNLKNELGGLKAASRRSEFNSFCEQLKTEGKLTPAMIPQVLNFMETLHDAGEYDFAEGDQVVKKPALESFKEFLQSLPKQVEFGEFATGNKAGSGAKNTKTGEYSGSVDEGRLAIHNKALEYMEAHPETSYKDALFQVMKNN